MQRTLINRRQRVAGEVPATLASTQRHVNRSQSADVQRRQQWRGGAGRESKHIQMNKRRKRFGKEQATKLDPIRRLASRTPAAGQCGAR